MGNVDIRELAVQEGLSYEELYQIVGIMGLIRGMNSDKVRSEDIPAIRNEIESQYPELHSIREETLRVQESKRVALSGFIVTSSSFIEGYRITEYVDFISSEAVMGMGFFKSIGASIDDITGSESTLSTKIQKARELAKQRIKEEAVELGCNAIIGMDIEMTMFGDSMVGVVCNGTAVKAERQNS